MPLNAVGTELTGPCNTYHEHSNIGFAQHHVIGNHGLKDHPCYNPAKDITIPTSNALVPAMLGGMSQAPLRPLAAR